MTPFGIKLPTEEAENEISPSVTLLHAGLLRRGMICEFESVAGELCFFLKRT